MKKILIAFCITAALGARAQIGESTFPITETMLSCNGSYRDSNGSSTEHFRLSKYAFYTGRTGTNEAFSIESVTSVWIIARNTAQEINLNRVSGLMFIFDRDRASKPNPYFAGYCTKVTSLF
jgi:hypothetical protein